MRSRLAFTAAASLGCLIAAVNGHSEGGNAQHPEQLEDGMTYAQYHMLTEHHLDSFDLESFFKLHDLNQDGILDRKELEAIYGLHHESAREKSPSDAEHDRKTEEIMQKVLAALDQNGDGLVTKTEFVAAGKHGLPEFPHHEGLGHHYDSEGEYFLHHEEIYHSTPETQTEESYNHPEDLKHFEHHEEIERAEEDKARKAQGLPPTDPNVPLDDQTAQPDHDEKEAAWLAREKMKDMQQGQQVFGSTGNSGDQAAEGGDEEAARKARENANRQQMESLNEKKQKAKERGPWDESAQGFRKPKDKIDRLRDKIPYKYRVRSSFFGDF